MGWRKNTYRVHRWLGLIVALQLLAWSLGGLFFSLFDIERVRGTADAAVRRPEPLALTGPAIPPDEVLRIGRERLGADVEVVDLRLHQRDGRLVYELRDASGAVRALVDAAEGEALEPLTPDEAGLRARDDFVHPSRVLDVRLIERDPPLEYRGKRLPAYRVVLDHPKRPHIYVDPVTGDILARRSRLWRTFDFFWMLHIMDYGEREDFNHPLLVVASLLAVLTSASGVALWGWRAARFRRAR